MAANYSDESLRVTMNSPSKGAARAAGYLLNVPEDARAAVQSEGVIRAAYNGDRMADGVYAAVQSFLTGSEKWNWATKRNAEMMAAEHATKWYA